MVDVSTPEQRAEAITTKLRRQGRAAIERSRRRATRRAEVRLDADTELFPLLDEVERLTTQLAAQTKLNKEFAAQSAAHDAGALRVLAERNALRDELEAAKKLDGWVQCSRCKIWNDVAAAVSSRGDTE